LLYVNQHSFFSAPVGPFGLSLKRKYTPISSFNQKVKKDSKIPDLIEFLKGTFDLLVKIYRPNSHPDFPNGGRLTPYLESLKVILLIL